MSGEVDVIKQRLDVADIVGEHVPLKRAGAHFKGLCPFHQEKTPSFIVSPEKGIWHCFGCGKGGDIFGFVQEIEGVDFAEALKMLAERAGVKLESRGRLRQDSGAQNKRQRLFQILDLAAKFYHTLLMQHEAGKRAQGYLEERGVKEETMREFELGYAPMRWDTLQRFLEKKGFSPEEMVQAGLVGRGQGKFYDRFRGRIMFPIADVQGRVVAFGGRIVPWQATGEEGKYINSPETALYEKRRMVYNIARAKAHLRSGAPCIVAEGYMDVVLLHQAGIQNVVASSGTAFTADAIGLLARYTDTLHFAFDADAAGRGATVAATESALDAGMRVATIVLPAGQDPAEVVTNRSADVGSLFSQPQSLISVLLARVAAEKNPQLTEAHLEAMLPLLARVRNVVLKGEMVREIARILTIPEADVLRIMARAVHARTVVAPNIAEEERSEGSFAQAERALLGIMIVSSPARASLWGSLQTELFVDGAMRELYNTMHTLAQNIMEWAHLEEQELVASLPRTAQVVAQAVSVVGNDTLARSTASAQAEAAVILRALQRRYLAKNLHDIQMKLTSVSEEEKRHMLEQFQDVAQQLAAVTSHEA